MLGDFYLQHYHGHMAYGSRSATPPWFDGDVRDDTDGPQYEDMSIGENAEDDHVSPSPPPTTFGGFCNTPFTPSDAESVNEMSLAFKTLLRNLLVNFFFKHYINAQNSFLN